MCRKWLEKIPDLGQHWGRWLPFKLLDSRHQCGNLLGLCCV
jgi:hypothetical protein